MNQSPTQSVQENMYLALCALLTREGVAYRTLHHEPTFTSDQSARVRGEDVRIGGKALVMKVCEDFRLFVLSAARKIDSIAIKTHFNVKKSRFASSEELLRLTGLVPGSIPPFGKPLLPFEVFVDQSILDNERIAFNAGSLTDSIIMSVNDYLRIARPKVFAFSSCSSLDG
jgi:Ala-tRNA(Pro) deacylase